MPAREHIGAEHACGAVQRTELAGEQDVEIIAWLDQELHARGIFLIAFKRVLRGLGGQDIVDIIVLGLVHARHPDADLFAQGTAKAAFDIDGVKAAIRDFAIAASDIAWFDAVELDDTGGGVAAKQGALRPAQHFNALHIENREALENWVFQNDIIINQADRL